MIYNTCVVRIHSNKCHLQDSIYNTVIYCNNQGSKFHKKKQNSSAFQCWQHQLILNWEKTLPKLPASHLLLGRMDQSILQRCIPLGVSVFHESRLILPGAASATLAGKNVFGVGCLRVCVSVCVSASLVHERLKSVCDLFVLLSVCACVSVLCCVSMWFCLCLCQRLWQVCRFRAAVLLTLWSRSPLSGRQVMPSPQSQRWKSSKPWVPFLRWRVHTWPSVSTGLQMRDQKCLAQQRPSEQSADRRQVSPSMPGEGKLNGEKN